MKLLTEILQESLQYKPQQKFSELLPFLLEVVGGIIKRNCNAALEIGSADGGLTFILSKLFTRVIALDKHHTSSYNSINITRFTLDSHDPGPRLERIVELGPYDLIFLDGDHSYDGVKKDFYIYSPLLAFGGIIAFHDIKDTEVQRQTGCFVSKFVKELQEANLHISTKIFNSFDNEWAGNLEPEKWVNAGGIQMFKFL